MKIYIAMIQYLYDHDVEMTTHLTLKGALIEIITRMTEDLCNAFDEDELEEHRPDMPHNPEEDLMSYSSDQLARKFSDWLEYSHGMSEHMSYDWYETEVRA
jgi:HD superfamily phosphohydrolase